MPKSGRSVLDIIVDFQIFVELLFWSLCYVLIQVNVDVNLASWPFYA